MSVGERYSISIRGLDEGLELAGRLGVSVSALPRWAATWTRAMLPANAETHFEAGRLQRSFAYDVHLAWVPCPSVEESRQLVSLAEKSSAEKEPFCVHYSPVMYTGDEGDPGPWISYVGDDGLKRDDARVYALELAHHARPLTTAARPEFDDFVIGPQLAKGWALHVSVVRDHMPSEALVEWLAVAAGVPAKSVRKVVYT